MKTAIIVVVTIVLTLVAAGAIMGVARGKDGDAAETKQVRVEKPERGDLTEFVDAQAEVQPRTKVAIRGRVSARIVELPFEEGDHVSKGDPGTAPPVPASVLVRLNAADLEAGLASAEAQRAAQAAQIEVEKSRIAAQKAGIEGTRASLSQARRDLERQRSLLATRDVSQATVDALQSTVETLEAELDAAAHSLKAAELNLVVLDHRLKAADAEIARARDNLTYTTITSTIDGVVTRVYAEVGELVVPGTMNNPGTVIMEVADLSEMLLVARVDETDVGRVRPGQLAHARIQTSPDETIDGSVESVALIHDVGGYGTRYYQTEILLDTEGHRVFCGASADVKIEAEQHKDVLKLPSQCVLERPVDDLPVEVREGNANVDMEKTYATVVYRVADGKAAITPVRIGPSDETHTTIEAGLSEDDAVIAGPYKVLESIAHEDKVQDEREAAGRAGNGDDEEPSGEG